MTKKVIFYPIILESERWICHFFLFIIIIFGIVVYNSFTPLVPAIFQQNCEFFSICSVFLPFFSPSPFNDQSKSALRNVSHVSFASPNNTSMLSLYRIGFSIPVYPVLPIVLFRTNTFSDCHTRRTGIP